MTGLLAGTMRPSAPVKIGAGWKRTGFILAFILPAFLLFTLLVVLPMVEASRYSLYDWNGYGAPVEFVGWENYLDLASNRTFLTALKNNALIICVSIVVQIPLAIWLATIVAQRLRGAVWFRALFFLPYVLAEVAAGLIWRFVYDGNYGAIAAIATWFGFEAPFVLADRDLAMPAVLIVIVWKYFGFHMMLFIAGLQSIPRDLYEAAEIDGASRWQRFVRVTLPLLRPTIALSVFFSVLGALQLFDVIMSMTEGGPSNSTQTLVTYLYIYGIGRLNIGFGSAVGIVLFVICTVFAFTYKRAFLGGLEGRS
jgi:raffinose/stachyose/melibiose transport system permease protein